MYLYSSRHTRKSSLKKPSVEAPLLLFKSNIHNLIVNGLNTLRLDAWIRISIQSTRHYNYFSTSTTALFCRIVSPWQRFCCIFERTCLFFCYPEIKVKGKTFKKCIFYAVFVFVNLLMPIYVIKNKIKKFKQEQQHGTKTGSRECLTSGWTP